MKQLFTLISLALICAHVFSQPNIIEGSWKTGTYVADIASLADRGSHKFYRDQSSTSGSKELLFRQVNYNYDNTWKASTGTDYTKNSYLNNEAKYGGSSNIHFSVNNGDYYTFIIGKNTGSDNDISILETSYNPKDISSVTRYPTTVNVGQDVTVTINVASALSSGEYAYLRYTTNSWASSTIVAFSMSGTSGTATIPSQALSTAVAYYVFTSNQSTAPTASQADYYSLNIYNASGLNVSGSNFTYTVSGWATVTGASNWSAGSSWNGGVAPVPGINMGAVSVNHSITMDQDNTVSSLAIGTGATVTVQSAKTLIVTGGINGLGLLTISGNLQFNSGGYTSIAPTYNSGSTLKYNTGGTYNRSNEWSGTTGAGYPNNVQLSNNTILNLGYDGAGSARQCAGNLTIDNGSELSMNITPMTAGLTVKGNFENNGTFTLSGSIGGDLYVEGNWTKGSAATFNNNSRATFFVGTNNQTITATGGGTVTFGYFVIDKASGSVKLNNSPATNLSLTGSSGGVFQLNNSVGMDLNGQTMTMTKTGGSIKLNSGNRTITSSIAGGIFVITNSTSGSYVSINTPGTLTFGSNVTLSLDRIFDPTSTSSVVTVNGTLQINTGGGLENPLTYGSNATLIYASNALTTSNAWLAGSTVGVGVPKNVILNMSGVSSALTLAGERTVPGNLTITQGVLNAAFALDILGDVTIATNGLLDGNDVTVTVNGDWNANSTQSYGGYTGGSTCTVNLNGSGTRAFTHAGGATFKYLILSGTGSYTINNDMNVQVLATISNGTFNFGVNRLYGTAGLTMSSGLLQLGRTGVTLPELDGTYTLTGGTIELNGVGSQTLRGARNYRNLTFSNSGTKGVTSAPSSITGTITIADAAILDASGASMGGVGTNVTMTGTSKFIVGNAGLKPSAQGTYTLGSGTTIEFSGSGDLNPRVSSINYYHVIVSGTNVNTTGTGTGLTFQSGGSFTVKSAALFAFEDPDGFSGTVNTAINNTNSPTITLETNSTIGYRGATQTVTNAMAYKNLRIGAAGTKTLGGAITVEENLDLYSGTLADNGHTITLSGNILGTGTHSGTGKILMTGASATIDGATLGNLHLDNAAGFSLSGSPTITNVLTFINGKLSLGDNSIRFTSNSTTAIAGFTGSKYFVTNGTGYVRRAVTGSGAYDFPVGSSGNYNPAKITWAGASGTDQLSGRFIASTLSNPTGLESDAYGYLDPATDVPTPVTEFLNNGYWEINSTGTGTPNNYTIDLTASGASNLASLAQQHTIFKNSTTGPTGWAQAGDAEDIWGDADSVSSGYQYTATPNPLHLQNTNVSGFSYFGIGRSYENVLPIVLTEFTAVLINTDVLLNWTTASEVNNDYFTIERSMDGSIWNAAGQIEGAGSSSTVNHYDFIDKDAPGMVLYYRLKQTDFNGNYEYSDIRVINNLGNEAYIIYGYYTLTGQKIESLENAPTGIYLQLSNKGNTKIFHSN